MTPDKQLSADVLEYMAINEQALQKLAAENEALRAQVSTFEAKTAACAGLIPGVVSALIANDRIPENMDKTAAAKLRDPVEALQLLIKVAQTRNHAELGTRGQPVKVASANAAESATDALCRSFGIDPNLGAK
jgi:hypothetical protein